MRKFTSEESQKIMKQFKSIISSRLDKLYNEFGPTVDGELYAYSIAVNGQKRKQEKEPTIEEPMNSEKLKEMVTAALSNPKKADLNKDDQLSDYEKKRGAAIEKSIQKEDLDLGHEDDEPHMIKAELYRIGKYAMELYKMVDQFEGEQEVDFPAWWQAKITTAKNMISSTKHYLQFELEEPKIDAMVGVASEEGVVDEGKLNKKEEKIVKGLKKSGFKKDDPEMYAIARSKAKDKIKEAILAKLKNK